MKKYFARVFVFVALFVLSFGISYSLASDKVIVLESFADYYQYKDLAELENKSEVIVEVKFTGDRELHHINEGETIIDTVSKSTVQVKKVHKGNIELGDKITVYEPGYFYNESTYIPTEGYNLMNKKGRYILFLITNPVDDTYVLVGGHQGKYDLEINGVGKSTDLRNADYLEPENKQFLKLKNELVNKY